MSEIEEVIKKFLDPKNATKLVPLTETELICFSIFDALIESGYTIEEVIQSLKRSTS